jgi:hypothetical protein
MENIRINNADLLHLSSAVISSRVELDIDKAIKWWEFAYLLKDESQKILDIAKSLSSEDKKDAQNTYLLKDAKLDIAPFLSKEDVYNIANINKWNTNLSILIKSLLVE